MSGYSNSGYSDSMSVDIKSYQAYLDSIHSDFVRNNNQPNRQQPVIEFIENKDYTMMMEN